MRAKDFIFELRMNPRYLERSARSADALAGIEFEMYVPSHDFDSERELEPDYSENTNIHESDIFDDHSDIFAIFTGGELSSSKKEIQRAIDRAQDSYEKWLKDAWSNYLERNIREFIKDRMWPDTKDEWASQASEGQDPYDLFVDYVENTPYKQLPAEYFDQLHDENFHYFAEAQSNRYDWMYEMDIRTYSDFADRFGLDWPYWSYPNDTGVEDIANSFAEFMNVKVVHSGQYKGAERQTDAYVVEPDGSLDDPRDDGDLGLEFVSPPLPLDQMVADINRIKAFANKVGAYTDEDCGLHMNISIPGYDIEKLDYIKMALFVGDNYVLDQFDRVGSTYAKSAIEKIISNSQNMPGYELPRAFFLMRQQLQLAASKSIHSGITEKYTSINVHSNRVEFRSPGGNWLDIDTKKLTDTLYRFVVALTVACDPSREQHEYAKKFYKLLAPDLPGTTHDLMRVFTQYNAGLLSSEDVKRIWAATISQGREIHGPKTAGRSKELAQQMSASQPVVKHYTFRFKDPNQQPVAVSDWSIPDAIRRLATGLNRPEAEVRSMIAGIDTSSSLPK